MDPSFACVSEILPATGQQSKFLRIYHITWTIASRVDSVWHRPSAQTETRNVLTLYFYIYPFVCVRFWDTTRYRTTKANFWASLGAREQSHHALTVVWPRPWWLIAIFRCLASFYMYIYVYIYFYRRICLYIYYFDEPSSYTYSAWRVDFCVARAMKLSQWIYNYMDICIYL